MGGGGGGLKNILMVGKFTQAPCVSGQKKILLWAVLWVTFFWV